MNVRWSGLLSPRKVVGAVTDELAFDLLRVDAAIEVLTVASAHRQGAVRRRASLECSIAPPHLGVSIGDRQPRRSAEILATPCSGVTLRASTTTSQGVSAADVLRGDPDVDPVECAARRPRRCRRLRMGRQTRREDKQGAQQAARETYLHCD